MMKMHTLPHCNHLCHYEIKLIPVIQALPDDIKG